MSRGSSPWLHSDRHSLCSTQEVLTQNGPMNRMTSRRSLCRCSSVAKGQFYNIQINILVDLSIIYQHFSVTFSRVITKGQGCKSGLVKKSETLVNARSTWVYKYMFGEVICA